VLTALWIDPPLFRIEGPRLRVAHPKSAATQHFLASVSTDGKAEVPTKTVQIVYGAQHSTLPTVKCGPTVASQIDERTDGVAMTIDHDSPNSNKKVGLLVLLAVLAVGGYWLLGDRLTIEYLAAHESALHEYRQRAPVWTAIMAIAFYVAVTGFSLPGAAALTLAYGWYFGFWQSLFIVSFGSTGGATLAFLMTRYVFRGWVQQKLSSKLDSINKAFDREGAFYLFTLRLIPAVPFFVINAIMGLTKIRAITFWWVSQLGMLPGTAAYVYAGSTVPSLKRLAEEGVRQVISWQLLLAFAMLGLLPLVIKRIVSKFRPVTTIEFHGLTHRP
jgi:uncharacterized membrane protein YdjX (TVP38/TMEM64 family)